MQMSFCFLPPRPSSDLHALENASGRVNTDGIRVNSRHASFADERRRRVCGRNRNRAGDIPPRSRCSEIRARVVRRLEFTSPVARTKCARRRMAEKGFA